MQKKIKIIIADDHLMFIDGLKLLLEGEADIEIIDVANDGRELLGLLKKSDADIILLDINMPYLNGLDAMKYISQSLLDIKIIVLSTYNEEHLIEKAKGYGANGYLLKNSGMEELLQTIRLVANGQTCFPVIKPIPQSEFDASDNFLKQFNLTKREMEILQLIKNNQTNQQIADTLFLSIYTVETHRKNIMQKLGLNNPVSLMKFIINNNI